MKIENTFGVRSSNLLNQTTKAIQRSLERLSTGKRINSPADDTAGYSTSVSLEAQIRGLGQANNNINTAVGLLQTADSAIAQQVELAQQLRELAVQAGNGTLTADDRSKLANQINGLITEFSRITSETEFNGIKLLDGSFDTATLQIGANTSSTFDVSLGNLSAGLTFEKTVGAGTFRSVSTLAASADPEDFVLADLDKDGNLDLVAFGDQSGTAELLTVRLGNGDGTFDPIVTYATPTSVDLTQIRAADINNDNVLDILIHDVTNDQINVYQGNGDGTFKARVTYATGVSSSLDFAVSDINGDGYNDIVVANATTNAGILLNNGSGAFLTAQTITTIADSDSVFLQDLNGDGKKDLFVLDNDGDSQILTNDGSGNFTSVQTFDTSTAGTTVNGQLADLDNDGDIDILVANGSATGLNAFLNDGAGNFSSAGTITSTTASSLTEFQFGDFNNDGILDVVAIDANDYQILAGTGSGSFSSVVTGAIVSTSSGLQVGDINNDGVLDFASISTLAVDVAGIYIQNSKEISALSDAAVANVGAADRFLGAVDNAIENLNDERSNIALALGRLEQASNYNGALTESYTEAKSSIEDADLGLETSNLVKNQILQQAQVAAFTQANTNLQIVLGLLRF